MKRGVDHLENAGRIFDYVIVPEAQDSEASSAKIGIALPVRITVAMLTAIRFDDQQSLQAGEIHNVWCDDMLPLEFERKHASVAEHGPESPLGKRGISAHR